MCGGLVEHHDGAGMVDFRPVQTFDHSLIFFVSIDYHPCILHIVQVV
jgi:hypothetical protein